MRPFLSVDNVEKKMVRRSGVSSKLFENYKDLIKGYNAVDAVLESCEQIGKELDAVVSRWSKADEGAETGTTTPDEGDVGLHLTQAVSPRLAPDDPAMQDYISQPPALLASNVALKSYQMLGLNWLNLLHTRGHSCILADEMGMVIYLS
jgi:SWI/SNF-related matrix-associated actin-dependent regulator 1 of chromatin subfamily A